MIQRRSMLTLAASAILAATVAVPAVAQSPSAPAAASIPAGPSIAVVGTDYHFGGLPTTVPVGTVISFENQGAELHEIVVFRKNDDVTQSFEELLQLPDDQALQYVTMVGEMPLFAAPGATAEGTLTIAQEGEYIALCFVPQGFTELPAPDASIDPALMAAPPHFALGMVQTFTVTPAGTEVGPLPSEMPMGSPAA